MTVVIRMDEATWVRIATSNTNNIEAHLVVAYFTCSTCSLIMELHATLVLVSVSLSSSVQLSVIAVLLGYFFFFFLPFRPGSPDFSIFLLFLPPRCLCTSFLAIILYLSLVRFAYLDITATIFFLFFRKPSISPQWSRNNNSSM